MTTALLEPGPAATVADSTLVVAPSLDAATARAPRSRWLIAPVLALSATLNSWALTSVGWGNGYYSAAVHSMSKSWKAFLFAGFDRAGFVTVDKPPFSLWVQTLSVRVFGFSKPAILIPQLVGGTLAVWLVYLTVARVWGRGAGLVGALALAVTPINVMVNHSNNTDATLVLLMTLAAYLAVRASTSGSLRWLVLACAVAGTAMTAKMLAAVPVMPGILAAYGWCAPLGWRRRLRDVTIGLVTLAVAGLWWFTLVDLWPKDSALRGLEQDQLCLPTGVRTKRGEPGRGRRPVRWRRPGRRRWWPGRSRVPRGLRRLSARQ